MESLDVLHNLNLRADECSFLEIALADVRRYVEPFATESEKQAVLVFPPLNPRNRFLIHTLVQNFFKELNTVSIGSSHGRRTVVYHRSLKPMSCGTELGESKKNQNENYASMQRAYRTPRERKAQEKLFDSLIPKTTVDKTLSSTQRKQCRRPDIPIYVPKARRILANKTESAISRNTDGSNSTTPCTFDNISRNEVVSVDTVPLRSKETTNSISVSQLISKNKKKSIIEDSFKFIDLTNEMSVNNECNEVQTYNDVSCDVTDLSSGDHPDILSICELNSSISHTINGKTHFTLMQNKSETNIEEPGIETVFDNRDYRIVSKCLSDNGNTKCIQNGKIDDSLNFQTLNNNEESITENLQLIKEIKNDEDVLLLNDSLPKLENGNENAFIKIEHESSLNQDGESSSPEIDLLAEFNTNCPHYCLDDSFASGPLTDIDEKNCYDAGEESIEIMINQKSSEIVSKPTELEKNYEKEEIAKKKKKKVLDVDECCWEDLYDKEDDYVHPLLMKELVSTIGKVQVKCTKEDYRAHQTIEERSGDGECVIEVYGFSSDLKTVDLMNQFAEFRQKHFEIIWVNDTHALAVFENPNLADRALNTPFALVKTRPLKNAIKESKLKAKSITPLPATRPKTCTAMARRLVSSALGLKMAVSPDLLHAERTLLADAKEKKNRDTQQKHSIWNDT